MTAHFNSLECVSIISVPFTLCESNNEIYLCILTYIIRECMLRDWVSFLRCDLSLEASASSQWPFALLYSLGEK